MNVGSHQIDENLLAQELEQIVAEDMPEQLFSWNELGKETLIRELTVEKPNNFEEEIDYVPKAIPEMKDVITWLPLVLLCVNTVLQIFKEKLIIQKELKLRSSASSDETEKTQIIEKKLRLELRRAGLEESKISKHNARLAKTILKALQ